LLGWAADLLPDPGPELPMLSSNAFVQCGLAAGIFGLSVVSAWAEPLNTPEPANDSAPPQAEPAQSIAPSLTPQVVAKPLAPPKPATTLVANVDLAKQQLTVLVNGRIRHQWAISSGRADFPTPVGQFRPEWMAKMWYSKTYDDAEMPHAVFFKDGAAIHATQATGMLGRPASHGCVRLAPANAAQFYALVQSHGIVHTKINVSGTPKYAPVTVARRDAPDRVTERSVRRYPGAPMGYGRAYAGYPSTPPFGTTTYGRPQIVYYGSPYGSGGLFAPSGYRVR
jgi:lipoprotein-anchoring transpeptidase ErfK/SrfK